MMRSILTPKGWDPVPATVACRCLSLSVYGGEADEGRQNEGARSAMATSATMIHKAESSTATEQLLWSVWHSKPLLTRVVADRKPELEVARCCWWWSPRNWLVGRSRKKVFVSDELARLAKWEKFLVSLLIKVSVKLLPSRTKSMVKGDSRGSNGCGGGCATALVVLATVQGGTSNAFKGSQLWLQRENKASWLPAVPGYRIWKTDK